MKFKKEFLTLKSKKYKVSSIFYQKVCPRKYILKHYGRNFITQITSHMIRDRNNRKWTKQKIYQEAKKFKYRSEFKNGSKSAYVAAVRYGKKFLDRCCSHMLTTKELTTYWTKPMVIKEALKYHQINHFKTNSPQAYNKSRKFGKYFHKKTVLT